MNALGKAVDVGTILKDIFVDDDMRSAVSNIGGIAGGMAGSAIVAPVIVGGFTGPAVAVMATLIGITCALTGKEATELVYDLLHENEN